MEQKRATTTLIVGDDMPRPAQVCIEANAAEIFAILPQHYEMWQDHLPAEYWKKGITRPWRTLTDLRGRLVPIEWDRAIWKRGGNKCMGE